MHATESTTGTPSTCASVQVQLQAVKDAINEFESKKLGELKGELESFVKKQETLRKEYAEKFPELRRRWCRQEAAIENRYCSISKCFPTPLPPEVVKCLCLPKARLIALKDLIAKRKQKCGVCELPRDTAKEVYETAKSQLDTLLALTSKLDAVLTANGGKEGEGGLIKKIGDLLVTPGRIEAVYWFQVLIASHRKIKPFDLSADCEKKIPPETDYCTSTETGQAGAGEHGTAATPTEIDKLCAQIGTVPRLLDPKTYPGLLDCAWACVRGRKDELATAESALKRDNDQFAAWVVELEAKTKSLDDDITSCLKSYKPLDPCCPPAAGTTNGA